VETISHSKIWKDSAIFGVEDDTQNGTDHDDGHRDDHADRYDADDGRLNDDGRA
jgi:hypothetical protein